MRRMEFDPNDYTENGAFGSQGGIVDLIIGLAIWIIFSQISYFYFSHTSISIIGKAWAVDLIAIVIAIIEVVVINYIRNRKVELAEYPNEFDTNKWYCLLIALFICSFYINCIFFCEINGRLDSHESTKRNVKLINKRDIAHTKARINHRYFFEIEDWNRPGKLTEFQVSQSIYEKTKESMIEFETKPGLLGFEHLSSEVTNSK